jgi:hypothetical protein
MSWEALGAIAAAVTAVVITVTAIVAVVQIRHLRTANQLSAALSLYHEIESPDLCKATSFVRTELEQRMQDPVFREELASGKFDREVHLEIRLGNYWQQFGLLVRTGLIDRRLFLDWGWLSCLHAWRDLRDVTTALRTQAPDIWRDFEYLARLASAHVDSTKRHPIQQPKWREGLEPLDVPKQPAGR